jgi:hypothetical protein
LSRMPTFPAKIFIAGLPMRDHNGNPAATTKETSLFW